MVNGEKNGPYKGIRGVLFIERRSGLHYDVVRAQIWLPSCFSLQRSF
jgi:hypothetical protein